MSTPSTLSGVNVNINSLNVITFIKDIYLSLKHIDACFSSFKNNIDSRMNKLEGQYETILERFSQLEIGINQMNEQMNQSSHMNSAIEKELLDKMYTLASTTENSNQLELKPKDLTIANILENSFTMQDIEHSLSGYNDYKPLDISDNLAMPLNKFDKPQTLDNLLFDCN